MVFAFIINFYLYCYLFKFEYFNYFIIIIALIESDFDYMLEYTLINNDEVSSLKILQTFLI